MSVPNPLIIDAQMVAQTNIVQADSLGDGAVNAETLTDNRPMPHITIGDVQTLATGEDATATMTGDYVNPVLNLGLPRGEQGIQGVPGPQGERGEQGVPGQNGRDGRDGTDGSDGRAGFSPIATVSKVGDTATITITDQNGTTTTQIYDGTDGQNGEPGAPGAAAGFGSVTASVDANTGTPSVDVSTSGPDTAKNFAFAFHNLKGQNGSQGEPGTPGAPGTPAGFGTPSASATTLLPTDSATASVTASGSDTAKVFSFSFGIPSGQQGETGPQGPIGPDYELIEDTRSSNVAAMTGTCATLTEIKNGTRILFHLNYASAASTTLNLTLADSTKTGAKKVYRQGTTQLAASIGIANCILPLTYLTALDSGNGGWMMDNSYDSNTNTIGYQLRTNSTILVTSDACRYYKIFFTSADGKKWVPAAANTTNSATSAKTVNQRPIDPFGRIVYTSATTSYAAGADIAATTIWDQYNLTLGYSFNRTGAALTLTTKTPVYIKCAPQTNGSAIIDSDNPYVQALPSTEDNKIYIFLGIATSATQVELVPNHPVYYYKGGAIRLWTNLPIYNGGVG